MKLVETYTGDGNFKVQIDKDPRTNRVTARATGKSLSEVVPVGFMLPAAVAGLVMRSAPAPMAPPPALAVPPGKVQTGAKKPQPQPQRRQ